MPNLAQIETCCTVACCQFCSGSAMLTVSSYLRALFDVNSYEFDSTVMDKDNVTCSSLHDGADVSPADVTSPGDFALFSLP